MALDLLVDHIAVKLVQLALQSYEQAAQDSDHCNGMSP